MSVPSDHIADCTLRVAEVVGVNPHPGRLEGGTNIDHLFEYSDGSDYYGSVDENGYIQYWEFTLSSSRFGKADIDEFVGESPNEQDVINAFHLREFCKAAVSFEDDRGFFYIRYFSDPNGAYDVYKRMIRELYPEDYSDE
jgi:hypothetical protein